MPKRSRLSKSPPPKSKKKRSKSVPRRRRLSHSPRPRRVVRRPSPSPNPSPIRKSSRNYLYDNRGKILAGTVGLAGLGVLAHRYNTRSKHPIDDVKVPLPPRDYMWGPKMVLYPGLTTMIDVSNIIKDTWNLPAWELFWKKQERFSSDPTEFDNKIKELGFTIRYSPPDGTCMYQSIAQSLWDADETYADVPVRNRCSMGDTNRIRWKLKCQSLDFVRDSGTHETFFENGLPQDVRDEHGIHEMVFRNITDWYNYYQQDEAYGDDSTLGGIVNLYNLRIIIFKIGEGITIHSKNPTRDVFLRYDGNHYDTLLPRM